jgi:peptidoglycan/xylan/chitin deacetylase (PgdA/CDA1 family)
MTVRVLAYHSHNISGAEYATNDHVALASDLETMRGLGARIESLEAIAGRVRDGRIGDERDLVVGLSFDDGPVFDFEDFEHPRFGPQRSFANILRDFTARTGMAACATSFVIASPEARRAMERAEDCGYPWIEGWLREAWWPQAIASGIFAIGNHSWDHVHHAPERIAADVRERDNFALVATEQAADAEIRQASDYINARVGGECRVFAYPFGHVNGYLESEYLPRHVAEHRMQAAFGVGDAAITRSTSVWNIPRVVCGHHWRHPAELRRLLS